MATKILGPTGSRRRRRFLFVPMLLVACTALFLIGSAQAVHETDFQLDGETTNTAYSAPTGSSPDLDWNDLFTATGGNTSAIDPVNGPFTNAAFVRDFGLKVSAQDNCSLTSTNAALPFCTADATTYATGSKDTLEITPGWQCNRDNNVNSKIDIMNAYSAAYTAGNGDKIMYFGMEKNKDNGTNNVGFWFLQGNANCVSPGGNTPFTGTHQVGDVLVVSEFSSGGGVSTILAYKWVGGNNPLVLFGSGGDCKTSSPNDVLCATTNATGTAPWNQDVTTKWLTADATEGVGNTVVPPDFFEGGINLTKAFQQAGGGTVPSCFNTFIGNTRSSTSLTATLFDYARGRLGQCSTTLTTQAGSTANGGTASPTSIGGGSVSSGTDTATLSITGTSAWGGTLSWYLCGPITSGLCDRTQGVPVTSRTVSNSSLATDFVSGAATLTSAGRYCWTAHFEPNQASKDAGVLPADDNGVGECFTVAPVAPSLTTCSGTFDASNVCTPSAPVTFGSAVSDRALLSGLATEPGSGGGGTPAVYTTINPATAGQYAGSIEFTLKGPADTGCGNNATGTGTNPQSVNVDPLVGNKVYGPVSFTPDLPGKYHWQATISNALSVNNTLPVSDNALCDQAREDVVVQQIPTSIKTKQSWFPNDTATISSSSGNLGSSGTVDFFLYDNATCSGSALYSQRVTLGTGLGTSAEVSTSNYTGSTGVTPGGGTVTPYSITTGYDDAAGSVKGPYSWKVVYTPHANDSAHTGKQSACDAERHSITYTNDPGPGTNLP